MVGYADVEKLRGVCAPGAAVLSLYLAVPLDPAGIRGLAAAAAELMASAVGPAGGTLATTGGRHSALPPAGPAHLG